MNALVKDAGGVIQRVFEAINGFKTKHGYWPNQRHVYPELVAVLATNSLAPLGFLLLRSEVRSDAGREGLDLAFGQRTSGAPVTAGCLRG
ncbi:hypothetical protein [Ramlibacter rhizophilus]|uniref:Uncharacterized protein n=1 Tax=Ramlibacter rhizophilus TaxID=1781167 RepID=A0A4Z0C145_9BURK|nr:hypothetical protein [Ramlibacter rhizophilus]TFZ04524.1 hypothetical protein EZ242_01880 [Ramlibacter rhizophilus]